MEVSWEVLGASWGWLRGAWGRLGYVLDVVSSCAGLADVFRVHMHIAAFILGRAVFEFLSGRQRYIRDLLDAQVTLKVLSWGNLT